MANILEFLRTVLVDGDAQGQFRHDPTGYLKEGGFGDLTGEDVAEAMNVLRRSLPEPVAVGLEPFGAADGDGLPSIRPVGIESELEAAARVLGFAVDRTPAPTPAPAFSGANGGGSGFDGPPPPPAFPPPIADPPSYDAPTADVPSFEGSAEPPPTPAAWPEPMPGAPDADRAAAWDAPIVEAPDIEAPDVEAFEPEPVDAAIDEPDPEEVADVADGTAASFGATLDAAVTDARHRHDEAIRQYTDASGRTTRELGERLDQLIQEAQAKAGDITSAAEASVSQLHEEAVAARRQGEEEARAIVEQARREADEIRAAATADVEASRHEIESRRAALRAAEEQLRERLSGIDSLFRQALDDDPQSEGDDGITVPGEP